MEIESEMAFIGKDTKYRVEDKLHFVSAGLEEGIMHLLISADLKSYERKLIVST